MADTNTNINYSFADIERYISGSMTAKEMHDIERAALQDPFLADAIEGYQDADKQKTDKHLNEISAAIQGDKTETKIITLPKQKSSGWQIAASIIIIIGIGVLFFTKKSNNITSAPLASNDVKKEDNKDSFTNDENAKMAYPKQDSLLAALPNSFSISKQKKTITEKNKSPEKDEAETNLTASLSQSKPDTATAVASAPAEALVLANKAAGQQESISKPADTVQNYSLSEVIATRQIASKAKSVAASTWTTDKGKPFRLSEVETINIGRTNKKAVDTSVVKPEGGWQSFRDYLFSRLNKKDTARFDNTMHISGALELEFSLDKEGLPYNIRALHAQDSTTANEAISAMQQGPKWLGNNKKEKRLNLKY